jgi:hypothetical protein
MPSRAAVLASRRHWSGDSKLRVRDVCHGGPIASRAIVMQQKTKHPAQLGITATTREVLRAWIERRQLGSDSYLLPSRLHRSEQLGTRQYARLLEDWVSEIGLDPTDCGTHSIRRTKATLIYRWTKNLRAAVAARGTRGPKARCAISASMSTMRWRSPSRPRSDRDAALGGV